MGAQVSAGVVVSEIDLTTVIPAVSTSVGAFAGLFTWGPGYQRTLVDSEDTLVKMFGRPDNNTFESFFSAANFLAYSSAMEVVRVYDAAALNSFANTGTVANVQVDNYLDFANTTFSSNITFLGKYPGVLGNSLKISVCDSAAAFSSNVAPANTANTASNTTASVISFTIGSNTAVVNAIATSQTGVANLAANSVVNALTVGDYLKVGNSTIGFQYMKVTAVTAPTGTEVSVGGGQYAANGATISFANPYNLSTNIDMTTANRLWEYYNTVDKAPGTSIHATNLGLSTKDEIHVVVVDAGGKFTGVPGNVLEVYNALSRGTDNRKTDGTTNYYKNVLNLTSDYVYAVADRSGAATGLTNAISNATTTTPYTASFAGGADSTGEAGIALSSLALGWDLFKSKEDVDIGLLVQGKANAVGGLANYIIGNIAMNRQDCVLFLSPDSTILTNQDPAQYAVNFRGASGGINGVTLNSSYAVMDQGYKYQYDKYNDLYRWVPLNGDIAGLAAATDQVRDPWFSPAGYTRGQIKNVVKLHFNPNQAQRDLLYKNDVNPVVTFPGQGTILYGDKTMYGKPTAFSRINVRRLFIVLEKAISLAAQLSLFEFNDAFTQAQFRNAVEPYLRTIQGRRGIYDFRVVCDSTNNTPDIVDNNQFIGDIYIKPARSINFIQLNFVAVGTGVDFNTVVGQF